MSAFNLEQHEITVEEVHRNLPPCALYEHAILYEKDAHIAENGALVAYSGSKTSVDLSLPQQDRHCRPMQPTPSLRYTKHE